MRITDKKQFELINVFGMGKPNDAYSQYFVGQSFLNPLTNPKEIGVFLANVTFEPGCRNNWHIHHAKSGGGQILICTGGDGWYQEENKPAVSLTAGKVITIPAGGEALARCEKGQMVLTHRRRSTGRRYFK